MYGYGGSIWRQTALEAGLDATALGALAPADGVHVVNGSPMVRYAYLTDC